MASMRASCTDGERRERGGRVCTDGMRGRVHSGCGIYGVINGSGPPSSLLLNTGSVVPPSVHEERTRHDPMCQAVKARARTTSGHVMHGPGQKKPCFGVGCQVTVCMAIFSNNRWKTLHPASCPGTIYVRKYETSEINIQSRMG